MPGQQYSVGSLGGFFSQPYLSARLRSLAQPEFHFRQFVDVKENIGKNRGDTWLFDRTSNVQSQGGTLVETNTMPLKFDFIHDLWYNGFVVNSNLGYVKEDYMLEQLDSLNGTETGENPSTKSISRKDIDLIWLAGVIDGEGCIYSGVQRVNGGLKLKTLVTITNAHPTMIKEATQILFDNEIGFFCTASKQGDSKPKIVIGIEGRGRVKKLLSLVVPYMRVKQRRAELMLELIDYREQVASGNAKINDVGQYLPTVDGDPKIQEFISAIRKETHDYPSVLDYSRKANRPFGESSETTRLRQAIA